jgi:hypothetical protein
MALKKLYAGGYITKDGREIRKHCDTGLWVIYATEAEGGGAIMSCKTLAELRSIYA